MKCCGLKISKIEVSKGQDPAILISWRYSFIYAWLRVVVKISEVEVPKLKSRRMQFQMDDDHWFINVWLRVVVKILKVEVPKGQDPEGSNFKWLKIHSFMFD